MVSSCFLFPLVMLYKIKIIKKGNSLQNAIAVEMFHSYHFNFLYATLYSYVLFVANKTFFFLSKTSSHLRIFINVCISFLFYFWQDFYFFGNKGKKYNFMYVKFIFVLSLIICEKGKKNIFF